MKRMNASQQTRRNHDDARNPANDSTGKTLKEYFVRMEAGAIQDTTVLERLLSQEWSSLADSCSGGMHFRKLLNRLEDVSWQPPHLRFTVERHGATVLGSTRAELQDWCVDISTWTAELQATRRRQLRPTAPRVFVQHDAVQIAETIVNGDESLSLKCKTSPYPVLPLSG